MDSEVTPPSSKEVRYILKEVNKIRKKGCYCGKTRMKPVAPLNWSVKLYRSALLHAKDMEHNGFFDHISPRHGALEDRLSKVGYPWSFMGENIAQGQKSLKQALNDWKKSKSHCMLLMSPYPQEMALVKYRKTWVHHFGKKRKGRRSK